MGSVLRTEGMRGNGLLCLLSVEERRVGSRTLWDRLSSLPPPILGALGFEKPGFGVDPDGWYEPAFVHAVVDAVARGVLEKTMRKALHDAARQAVSAAMEVRPTYATLDSPERVTRLLNAVWRSAFSDGTIRVVSLGPHKVSVRRSGWSGHHPIVCRFGMEAFGVLYELAGAASPRMTFTGCLSTGEPDCSALIEW
jgi:hypothetical protein